MATVLVTGSNRGIGLQLCTQFTARGDDVIAVCRSAGDDLSRLGVRIIENTDVSDDDSVKRLQDTLGKQRVDILVNGAGILRQDKLGELDYEEMSEQFRVNALGPLRVTEALLDNLRKGSKVIIITSRLGSIEDNSSGGYYGYRASKTAVNQIGTNLRHELLPRGIAVALLHPGLVATELTGGRGIDPGQSARGLIHRIDELNLGNSGGFWHAEGYALPW